MHLGKNSHKSQSNALKLKLYIELNDNKKLTALVEES